MSGGVFRSWFEELRWLVPSALVGRNSKMNARQAGIDRGS